MEAGLLSKLPNKTLVMSNKNQFPFSFPCLKTVPALDGISEVRTTSYCLSFSVFLRGRWIVVFTRGVCLLVGCSVLNALVVWCGGPGRARETAPPVKLLFAATSPDPHTTGLYQNSRCTLRWGVPSFQFGLFMWDIMIPIHTHADGADYWVKRLTENIHR